MVDKIKEIYLRNKSVVLYLIFGAATTVVNIVIYFICYEILHISNFISTILAWLFSVIFAYVTNRKYVFESKTVGMKACIQEIVSFFGCRVATGVMDTIIMIVAVDLLHQNSMFWKIVSNVLVIIINYIASKFLIFKE